MTPEERGRKALEGVNIRKVLEESNLPIEIAAAIADRCEHVDDERYKAVILLRAVKDQWYAFTGYSQLKADIDHYLDESRISGGER